MLGDFTNRSAVVSSCSSALAVGPLTRVAPSAIDALVRKRRLVYLVAILTLPVFSFASLSRLNRLTLPAGKQGVHSHRLYDTEVLSHLTTALGSTLQSVAVQTLDRLLAALP